MKMRSVTEQGALDEFLSTAELAGTDFTAEKRNNIKIIHTDQKNPYLLSAAEERSTIKKQMARRSRLTVPRRPAWDEHTTHEQLDQREKAGLLDWRRGLAELQENDDLLMTPFERNLEVWRQLWRVIERSDLVVQIVDARNPLMFRCEDLENYVKEVDEKKTNLLLVNKADMMTSGQRVAWADYFEGAGINYRFFSAALARELNKRADPAESDEDTEDSSNDDEVRTSPSNGDVLAAEAKKIRLKDQNKEDSQRTNEETTEEDEDSRTRILTVDELENLFLENAPQLDEQSDVQGHKTTIGLVGYPNVGKSSTINALIGAKKVSVSSTPGKTKHFQTIHLSDKVLLCDCPGLVFPNFASTKAELVCNGILPIDQLREFLGPTGLVADRIPQSFFEMLYGLDVHIRPLEEGGSGKPTAEEILTAYAAARGFSTTGKGQPDQFRAARHVLKDYVNGKLLFCHPPPSEPPLDRYEFNAELYDPANLPTKRRAAVAIQQMDTVDSENPSLMEEDPATVPIQGEKSTRLDKGFFAPGRGNAGHLSAPFNYSPNQDGGKQLSGRRLKMLQALDKGVDPSELRAQNSKKHFKANKRKKPLAANDDI